MSRTDRNPAVRVEPGMRFGRPHIKGISTDMLADQVWAGLPDLDICDDYGLTRHELLIACWYEATHGTYQTTWGQWAREHYKRLADQRDLPTLPLPPDRDNPQ